MKKRGLQIPPKRTAPVFIKVFAGINSKLDESVLAPNIASVAYNFCFESGVLRQGYGIEACAYFDKHPVAGGGTALWIFKKERPKKMSLLMMSTQQGDIYYKDLDDPNSKFRVLGLVTLTSVPSAVTYRLGDEDVCLITTPTDGLFVWDGVFDIKHIAGVPNISSMTMHNERMFVTTPDNPNAVYFSDDFDPTNFSLDIDEGGYIEMLDERGSPQKCISYQNFVYIFREYGISRLTALGTQADFVFSNLFVSSGKIYPKTVCLCGDTVMFLASDGLYAFNGVTVVKALDNLSPQMRPSDFAYGGYNNGKYYVSLQMDFADEQDIGSEKNPGSQNNAMLVFDLQDGSYSVTRGIDIQFLAGFAAWGQMIAIDRAGNMGQITQCGCDFETALPKEWSTGFGDLGDPSLTKRVRQIDLLAKQDVTLQVETEKASKQIHIAGNHNITRKTINLAGKRFLMRIQCFQKECYLARPKLTVSY
ncbi:MAG: hypothetical protein FWD76_00450 [Firmicutes bacterium]|nr:hypothetical protein [Bacillota bacterium]